MEYGEQTRTYAYYVPNTLPDEPVPLVFTLHGGTESALTVWIRDEGQTWKDLADEHGFILILPEGRPDPSDSNNHHWNDCRSAITNPDLDTREDDVGLIVKLIDWAFANFHIDLDRVYANGASNGGFMSYRLGIEARDRFAAIAAIIASFPDPTECAPPPWPLPVLIMNGTADPWMPYEGGCILPPMCDRGDALSTDETVAAWVTLNEADRMPTVEELPDVVLDDSSTVTVFRYIHGIHDSEVMLYRVNNGGHTIPGPDPFPPSLVKIFGNKNRDISGPEEIWEFFSRHVRFRKGDVTDDGQIDVTDAIRVVNIILEIDPPPTDFELWAADCNTDGTIDILDILGIIGVILKIGTCP
jgi:polyhydroxybutyrate depolymerase